MLGAMRMLHAVAGVQLGAQLRRSQSKSIFFLQMVKQIEICYGKRERGRAHVAAALHVSDCNLITGRSCCLKGTDCQSLKKAMTNFVTEFRHGCAQALFM